MPELVCDCLVVHTITETSNHAVLFYGYKNVIHAWEIFNFVFVGRGLKHYGWATSEWVKDSEMLEVVSTVITTKPIVACILFIAHTIMFTQIQYYIKLIVS